MTGWIKLHRQLLSWEWFSDANTYRVFVYLLLMVNYKPSMWRGTEILVGQHITSADIIAQKLGLSRQMVRTSLNKLKLSGDITIKSTNKYSLITVVKWGIYQSGEERINHQLRAETTIDQPTKQPTNNHKQEAKEINNAIKYTRDYPSYTPKIKNKSKSYKCRKWDYEDLQRRERERFLKLSSQ